MKAKVLVQVDTENGVELYSMKREDALECQRLLKKGIEQNEWPDEVNEILDFHSERLEVFGVINTCGDGWGWYKPDEI